MALLTKYLKEKQVSGDVLDVYRDNLDAETIRGKIVTLSDEILQIEKYSDTGQFDGAAFIRLSDVTRIRAKGRELEFLSSVIASADSNGSPKKLPAQDLWSAVDAVHQEYGYVALFIEDIDPDIVVLGEIIDHDSDHLRLKEYGTLKSCDERELVLSKDEITRVDADGNYERLVRVSQSK